MFCRRIGDSCIEGGAELLGGDIDFGGVKRP